MPSLEIWHTQVRVARGNLFFWNWRYPLANRDRRPASQIYSACVRRRMTSQGLKGDISFVNTPVSRFVPEPCRVGRWGCAGRSGPPIRKPAGVEFRPQPQQRIHPPQILQIKARPSPHEGGWSMGPPRRPCQFNKEHKMCRPKSVTAGEGCLIRANILGRTCCRAESAAPKGGHQGDTGPKGIAVRTGTFSRWSK